MGEKKYKKMKVKNVYLIRHGETDFNDTGREQANKLYQSGILPKNAILFSSPLKRAVQTSRIYTQVVIEPNIDERINDRDFGKREGKTAAENRQRMDELHTNTIIIPEDGVEPDESVDQRLESFMTDLEKTLEDTGVDDVIIVTHSGIVYRLLLFIIGPKCEPSLTMEKYNEPGRRVGNTSISKFSILMKTSGHKYKFEYCKNIDHLN